MVLGEYLNRKESRNMGIECLRIVSMLMIVMLHGLGFGGILKNAEINSVHYATAWLLETACYGAVNIYALITGYVCVKSRHKISRIFELWLHVFFYSAGLTLLFYFLPGYDVGKKALVKSFLPVTSRQYWYFSAYFCLFVFMPLINRVILSLTRSQHFRLICTGGFLFCVLGCSSSDAFTLNGGYSFLWLAYIYIVGAFFKLYPEIIPMIGRKMYLFGYIACIIIACGGKLLIDSTIGNYSGLLISYLSPLILLSAVFLFLYFVQLKINHCVKFISIVSSLTFGVYVFSENSNIRNNFIMDRFVWLIQKPWYIMIGGVFIGVFVIYTISSMVDLIRSQIFSLLKVRENCDRFSVWIESRISVLEAKLEKVLPSSNH